MHSTPPTRIHQYSAKYGLAPEWSTLRQSVIVGRTEAVHINTLPTKIHYCSVKVCGLLSGRQSARALPSHFLRPSSELDDCLHHFSIISVSHTLFPLSPSSSRLHLAMFSPPHVTDIQ